MAAVLTNDVYKRLINPAATERKLVFVGRLTTFLIGLVPLAIALFITYSSKDTRLFQKMVTVFSVAAPPIAIPMLAGLAWRKASNRGAIAAFLIGVTVGLTLFFYLTPERVAHITSLHYLTFIGAKAKENILTFSTVLSTLVSLVAFSYLLPSSSDEKRRIDAFEEKLRTPVPPVGEVVGGVPAPFRVVGVCVIAVSLLMLGILPFMGWNTGTQTNLVVALAMLIPGVYWAVRAGGKKPKR